MARLTLALVALTGFILFSASTTAQAGMTIPGTSVYLNHMGHAGAATGQVAVARSAIATCNEADFNRAINELKMMQRGMNIDSKAGADSTYPGGAAGAEADEGAIRGLRASLRTQWAAAQPCTPPVEEAQTESAVKSSGANARKIRIKGPNSTDSEYQDAMNQAQAAIGSCNRGKFVDAMDWLDDLADDALYDGFGGVAEDIDRDMDNLERRWRAAGNKKTCYGLAYPNMFELITGAHVGAMHLHDSPVFVGRENLGGGNRILGHIKPDNTGTIYGIDSELRINLGAPWPNWFPNPPNTPNTPNGPNIPNYHPLSPWDFFIGLAHAMGNISDDGIDDTDLGAQTLLLPGVGGQFNPAGFSVNAPNNTLNGMFYDADYEYGGYRLGAAKTIPIFGKSGSKIRTFGGLEYSHTKINQIFGGVTNSNTLNFAYASRIKNTTWSPFVGVEGTYRAPSISEFFGSTVELNGRLRYAYSFNDTDATDTLNVAGFQPGTVNVGEQDESHDFRAGAGFTINPDGAFSVQFGGEVQHSTDSSPIMNRDGTRPSWITYGDMTSATAGVRFIGKF